MVFLLISWDKKELYLGSKDLLKTVLISLHLQPMLGEYRGTMVAQKSMGEGAFLFPCTGINHQAGQADWQGIANCHLMELSWGFGREARQGKGRRKSEVDGHWSCRRIFRWLWVQLRLQACLLQCLPQARKIGQLTFVTNCFLQVQVVQTYGPSLSTQWRGRRWRLSSKLLQKQQMSGRLSSKLSLRVECLWVWRGVQAIMGILSQHGWWFFPPLNLDIPQNVTSMPEPPMLQNRTVFCSGSQECFRHDMNMVCG